MNIVLPLTVLLIFAILFVLYHNFKFPFITVVVYISYANELRLSGFGIAEATRTAALLRLRPIMMTALVAALGLLPAALSTGVGSDTQKPFALVIVGGLFSRLLISVFLMPVLYAVSAREGDHLEV